MNAFFSPLELIRLLGYVFGAHFILRPTANVKLDCLQRKVRKKQQLAGWILHKMELHFCLGGTEEQMTEGGAPGFIRERESLIVCCCWNRSQRPVEFFGQGWTKLPCHKIIAERISVEFRVVSKGALCYSSLQAKGRTSALGQALLLTLSCINQHAFCILCLFILFLGPS